MDKGFARSYYPKVIYIFTIDDNKHKGLIKIGDTVLDTDLSLDRLSPNSKALNIAAHDRIKQYTNTAGTTYQLLHTEIAVRTDMKSGKMYSFRDYEVHRVLLNSGYNKETIPGTTASEWFRCDLKTAVNAIKAVKENRSSLKNSETGKKFTPIIFRPEQMKAIEDTKAVFKKGNKMLWNAKMRFGKTVTALGLVREMSFARTIIITHRPVVDDGWYKDFHSVFGNTDEYEYGSKQKGLSFAELQHHGGKFIYFASIQDLRGSEKVGGKFDKNNAVFSEKWDLVIVDEAHEGTKTALGEEVVNALVGKDTKLLALSGTPFNIVDEYESSVYTWDYIMEQKAKEEWDSLHFGDSNPYDDLPRMNIYTYDLGKLINNFVALEDKAFNFREFFRTGDDGSFVHNNDVLSFLNLITRSDDDSGYPFSTPEYRDLFRHSLWMVPGVSEAKALSKLLKDHPVFGFFKVVNVAGDGDEEEQREKALEKVRTAINSSDHTITLSCGKLTTGVTVPEWNAVFMLAGSYSTAASSYLQTIFRVQSPCNKDGMQKRNAFVFDFAPDRTLKMVAEAVTLSTKAGKTTESDRRILGDFLNFCPVISIEGTQMKEYSANKLLQQLKRAYAERAVQNGFDDTNLYNDELLKLSDVDLKEFEKLKGIIGSTKAQHKTKDIDINNQGFTEEEYEEIGRLEKKKPRELTPEEQARLEELKERKKNRSNAISILRGISIRMPLLIYGADIPIDEEFTLEKFLDDTIIDDSSWNEFMPQGVTREVFKTFMKYYDRDIFAAAGRRIRSIVQGADVLPPTQRVMQIASLFACFKNPDKETVLTPWRVVNMHMSDTLGGYSFYEENPPVDAEMLSEPRFADMGRVTAETLANSDAKILEINSKTGLYPLYVAYSIYRKRCISEDILNDDMKNALWEKTVSENVFVICKTPMAKYITRRTLMGYRKGTVNAHYFDDLINTMQNKQRMFIDKVRKPSYWGRKGDKMEFAAVVGNPPYQLETGGAGRQAKPIYNLFVDAAKNIPPKYVSMIMPSRWFAGGMGLDDFRESMINDGKLAKIVDFTNAKDCFPQISISGGVCYIVWDKENKDTCNFTNVFNNQRDTMDRVLNEYHILVRYNKAVSILHLVMNKKFQPIDSIISPLMPFGLNTNFRGNAQKDKVHNIRLYSSQDITYITKEDIKKGTEYLDKYKVIMSKMSAEHAGEPSSDGRFNVFTKSVKVIAPNEACTHSYFLIGSYDDALQAENTLKYLKTRFVRFLVLMSLSAVNLSKLVFNFVPLQDFTSNSDIDWSKPIPDIDKQLYGKYGLDKSEIEFIESMIKPME